MKQTRKNNFLIEKVIIFLKSEVEEALQSGHGMEEEAQEGGLPEEVLAQINERKAEMNAMRKDRRKNKELIGRFASQEVFFL